MNAISFQSNIGGADVSLIRSRRTLKEIEHQYLDGDRGEDGLRLKSHYIFPYQHEILKALSRETGKSQAAILREMIDEWCEGQLVEGAGSSAK